MYIYIYIYIYSVIVVTNLLLYSETLIGKVFTFWGYDVCMQWKIRPQSSGPQRKPGISVVQKISVKVQLEKQNQ